MFSVKVITRIAMILFGVFILAAPAPAQIAIIDACTFPTICTKLTPSSGGGPIQGDCWAMPILEDGWTERLECLGPVGNHLEPESYLFTTFNDQVVVFVEKVKLAPSLSGTIEVFTIVEDIFIIPCKPASAVNPMGEDFTPGSVPPMMILDDVTFPPITVTPNDGPVEYLCGVQVPMSILVSFFGPLPVRLDWFACADMDSDGTFYGQPPSPDLDLNGCPDSCLEVTVPGVILPRKGLDEKGSNLLNFLLNFGVLGLTAIDVFEPQPSSFIAPLLPGMAAGESHNTRPWCFTIDV